MKHSKIENLSQRVQEDCREYPNLYLNLIFGTIKAFVYVLVFSISLIYSFSWVYLTILFVYAILGTLLTHYVANPLIHLNYESQRLEATYRNVLTELNYKECVRVMLGLAKKQKHVTYLQQFYGQIGVILPIMAIAPLYFSTSMSLGLLMRFNSVSGTILDNLSYGVNSFSDINRLLSCKKRLKEAQIL